MNTKRDNANSIFAAAIEAAWQGYVDTDRKYDRTLVRAVERALAERADAVATAVGSCPCECNSGGFCGGCGHAGCGRR